MGSDAKLISFISWQNLYHYFKNQSNVTSDFTMPLPGSRFGHSNLLSQYISVGASAMVVWFEASQRPSTVEQEYELKKVSSFAPYHHPKGLLVPGHDKRPSDFSNNEDPPRSPNKKRRRRHSNSGDNKVRDRAHSSEHGRRANQRSKKSRRKGGEF